MVRILASKSMCARISGCTLQLKSSSLAGEIKTTKPQSTLRKSREVRGDNQQSSYFQGSILLDGMRRLCVTKRLMSLLWVVRAVFPRKFLAAAFVLGVFFCVDAARAQSITPA